MRNITNFPLKIKYCTQISIKSSIRFLICICIVYDRRNVWTGGWVSDGIFVDFFSQAIDSIFSSKTCLACKPTNELYSKSSQRRHFDLRLPIELNVQGDCVTAIYTSRSMALFCLRSCFWRNNGLDSAKELESSGPTNWPIGSISAHVLLQQFSIKPYFTTWQFSHK